MVFHQKRHSGNAYKYNLKTIHKAILEKQCKDIAEPEAFLGNICQLKRIDLSY